MMNKVDLEKLQIIAVIIVMLLASVFLLAGTFGIVVWMVNNT